MTSEVQQQLEVPQLLLEASERCKDHRTSSFKFRGAITETEIEESIRLLFEQHRLVLEGSGALSVGGLLTRYDPSF